MTSEGTITVVAEGIATAVPRRAILAVGLEAGADSPGKALRRISERANAVVVALRGRGIRGPALRTRGFSVQPQVVAKDGAPKVVGYWASYALDVEIDNLDSVAELVDAVADAAGDALRLHGFGTTIADPEAVRADALAAAIEAGRRKAERAATAAGVTLGRLVALTEDSAGPRPHGFRALSAARSAGPPVEAGEEELTARVTVTFEIAPPA